MKASIEPDTIESDTLDHNLPADPAELVTMARCLGAPLLIPDVHLTRRIYGHITVEPKPPRIHTWRTLDDALAALTIDGSDDVEIYLGAENGLPQFRHARLGPRRMVNQPAPDPIR